jgi:ribosomal-protein-serine acetyltransferase
VVGSCALMRRIGAGGLEIGYWIHPDWTGRGLVTMATAALTREAFRLPGTTHVEVHHDEANKASGAVPQRLGFTVVSRTEDAERVSPGESGITVVQRIDRGSAALI